MGDVTVEIDGNDVSQYAVEGSWTRRLNRPSTATVKVPMQQSVGGAGSILKITNNAGPTLVHHGRVLLCETDTGEDTGYTVYNSTDPMELWNWRPVRGDDCAFMPLAGSTIIDTYITGPQILEAMLTNTVDCGGGPPSDAEGEIFLDLGTFEGGGVDLTGAPVDWPMTIAELFSLLVSTGCLDAVITPTDPGGGVMGTIDAYNGDYGTDLSGSVVFQYGTGAFNVSRLRWNEDMTSLCNKLWYYMGPRVGTAADPAGDQHWCYNVQGDDPGLPTIIPNGETLASLLAERVLSRAAYGVRMDIQIFDATSEDCSPTADPLTATERELYRNRWETESWIRQQPRELIHVTPTRETEIGAFDIGDLVGVEAVAAVRGGFSGAQRVYEYTVSWDNDGVLALSELQTSSTADG